MGRLSCLGWWCGGCVSFGWIDVIWWVEKGGVVEELVGCKGEGWGEFVIE